MNRMVITGSAIFVLPGTERKVLGLLEKFPQVTFQVKSESGTELVVNLEAEDQDDLESLCRRIKDEIPDIMEINHVYVHFEEEVEKMVSRRNGLPDE
jgi:nitrate reductase NapAB chaperone NapD